MVVHTYNPKTQEAEEGGFEASLGSNRSELHSKTLYQISQVKWIQLSQEKVI